MLRALQGESRDADGISIPPLRAFARPPVVIVAPAVSSSKDDKDVKQRVSPGSGFCASSRSRRGGLKGSRDERAVSDGEDLGVVHLWATSSSST